MSSDGGRPALGPDAGNRFLELGAPQSPVTSARRGPQDSMVRPQPVTEQSLMESVAGETNILGIRENKKEGEIVFSLDLSKLCSIHKSICKIKQRN